MKKWILLTTSFAILATSVGFISNAFGQTGAGGTKTTAQAAGTKIAVVNIGYVFSKYKRAQQLKKELEDALDAPKAKAKPLIDQMDRWTKELREKGRNMKKADRDAIEENLLQYKSKLETMDREIRRSLGKRTEQNLETLWKEVNTCVKRVSETYGFQIVFGYGDPFEKTLMDQFPNINRKMQAMDAGSTVPLYVHGSVDLSKAVTDTLNYWHDQSQKPSVTPTSGARP